MFSKVRSLKVVAFVAVLLVLSATAALAASYLVAAGTATVDGNPATVPSEWAGLTGIPMCGGFKCYDGNHPATSYLYLQYNCSTQTLYAYDQPVTANGMDIADQFIALNTESNKIMSSTGGTPAQYQQQFAYVSPNNPTAGKANGWEASVKLPSSGSPYSLWFEAVVGGTTSGTDGKFSTFTLPGCSTAVTLSSFGAQSDAVAMNNLAVPGMAIAGLLALAGLLGAGYIIRARS